MGASGPRSRGEVLPSNQPIIATEHGEIITSMDGVEKRGRAGQERGRERGVTQERDANSSSGVSSALKWVDCCVCIIVERLCYLKTVA